MNTARHTGHVAYNNRLGNDQCRTLASDRAPGLLPPTTTPAPKLQGDWCHTVLRMVDLGVCRCV
ncbi:hypothetical protein OHA79_04115 [Streptomyces sp. NBC_00841]|uniref:hypothetical protein n=1 Tax=Streptomyces sp. NBC_00841 TaxID=2975847 RepID=UPI002DD8026D|nr:hypothetical protein [Streptomyces sp. NBC_00841]WRZ97163.1 hypothetical protein OHA79_04115 [Streptomyces sp. NBC_00841]